MSDESEMLALAVVLASEIGLGFSPDIQNRLNWGFSPWDIGSSLTQAIHDQPPSIHSSDTT